MMSDLRHRPANQYRKPNKKYHGSGIVVKARTNVYEKQKCIGTYVDVSGSMSRPKLQKALGVLKSIEGMKRVKSFTHYFDTRVRDDFHCGGGTDYEPIFEHAKKNGYTCIAIITDDSVTRFRGNYEVDGLWLVGVDDRWRNDNEYSISHEVNQSDGKIRANHFKISIVGQ